MEPYLTSFNAMGTEVEIIAATSFLSEQVEAVKALFKDVEKHLSRFRRESELSRLNASPGRPVPVSALLLSVLRPALKAARETDGCFDPTILDAVEASGYRQSFQELPELVERRASAPLPDFRRVHIGEDSSVCLEPGTRIDLGGFAKGWTVDAAVELLGREQSYIINAGGDLRAVGPGPDGTGWLVGIQDPRDLDQDLGMVRIRDAAVATSSVTRRRWWTLDGWAHHIIDPRTGLPAASGLSAVTVLAGTVAWAEVLAKTALLLGLSDGGTYLAEQCGVGAVLVQDDGTVTWTPAMEACREY
jgi:thiamine biosynthesis lipoprotein